MIQGEIIHVTDNNSTLEFIIQVERDENRIVTSIVGSEIFRPDSNSGWATAAIGNLPFNYGIWRFEKISPESYHGFIYFGFDLI